MRLEKEDRELLAMVSLVVTVNIVGNLVRSHVTGPQCESCSNQSSLVPDTKSLSFWIVTGAALVDSINPCAISTLLFLFAVLLATEGRKKMLAVSLAFIFSSYIANLLFGLGLIVLFDISGLSFLFHRLVAVLSMIIGTVHIGDWYRDRSMMEVPHSLRPKLAMLLRRITGIRAALLAGFVVTLLELPCTGGPYMLVLGLLAKNAGREPVTPLFLLLYYNVIFILPLVIISLLVYLGLSTIEESNEFKEKNRRLLHLVTGLTMLSLGAYLALA